MRKKRVSASKRSRLRVAGYVRVSSQRQAIDGDSLTAQRHEIEREVESRKRWEDWDVQSLNFYVDAGKSAKDTNRPELQRLIRDIEAGCVNIVVCCNLDRITRSMKNFVELWELFDRHNVDVICLRQKFDTSTPNGKAMLRSMMVFAELERDMTAERTFSTMLDRADRDCWNGGHVLGYVSDPQERGKLILDEVGAGIVRRIFNLFEELGSAGAVTRKLNDLGIRYPAYETRSGRGRGGKSFVKQKVIGILRNRIYLGEIRWGGPGTPHKLPQGDHLIGAVRPGPAPARPDPQAASEPPAGQGSSLPPHRPTPVPVRCSSGRGGRPRA